MRATFAFCLSFLLTLLAGCATAPDEQGLAEEVVRLNIRGTAFLGQQKWTDAETAFRDALALRPGDPLLIDNVAVALIQQGRTEEAEQLLRQALEIDPGHPYSRYNLGLLEKNQGRFEEAAVHFEEVASHDSEDLLTQYNLGIVLSRVGRDDESEAAFRKALELSPAHVSSLYGLGRFLLQKGRQEEGERLVALSQEIRARSGLDEAVGSQYGEQGPYALGVDYPADALAAPEPITVSFRGTDLELEAASRATLMLLQPADSPTLVAAAKGSWWAVTKDGAREIGDLAVDPTLRAVSAGDLDDDGIVDLVAVTGSAVVWLRQDEGGVLSEEAAAAFDTPGPADAALVDLDHDGDVDLFWCWTDAERSQCAVARNDGAGNLDPLEGSRMGLAPEAGNPGQTPRVGFSDFDNDRDIDLLVSGGHGVQVFTNQRDGTFAATPPSVGSVAAMAIADLNKDGFMDVVAAGPDGVSLLSNFRGSFKPRTRLGDSAPAQNVVVLDYDNDGWLDVAAAGDGGSSLWRNLGRGEWAAATESLGAVAGVHVRRAHDVDGDGDEDLVGVGPAGHWTFLVNEGGNANTWIRIASKGVGDNGFGIGAKVEVLAGALRQKFEITSPLPLHVGLGERAAVESVRHLWPGGVLQDEIDQPAGQVSLITQLDRKGTSCPLLYAWRAGGWRFQTDFLGGAAIGYQQAPGVFGMPDTDEYVRIEGGLEPDADGWLKVRLNNQLEEVIWFDQAQLVVVEHPEGTQAFPDERLMPGPPWPEFRLFVSDDVRRIEYARSVENEHDVTEVLRRNDGRFVDDFDLLPFKGYAREHTLELDLGALPDAGRIVLLLDGWIDYADSSANVAAAQAGWVLHPPTLAVGDGRGGFRETDLRVGFPAGLPKTMAVDLTGMFTGDDHRLRLSTNMRIYWDQARVLVGGDQTPVRVTRLDPERAELRWGGFPQTLRELRREPAAYSPNEVAPTASWKAHVGAYSAFGDVTPLISALDDRFVTTRNGDEVELRFRAPAPPAAGWTRTFVLFADGFGKDMDLNSAANNDIAPIPFHGMPSYPYPPDTVPPVVQGDGEPRRVVRPSSRGWPGAVPQPLAGG